MCGGVFDHFPKLQFIIGHMGEGLPFFFQRLDIIPMATTKLKRPIISYLKENVHYTFSGMNFPPTFLDLFLELGGVDRIMFWPIIRINPCRGRVPSWSKSRPAKPTRSALHMAMQNGSWAYDKSRRA